MPSERRDVKFPLWRKKIDGAMFDDKCTVLPIWVRDRVFNVSERFPHRSKNHPESKTAITITHQNGKKTNHEAHVTTLPRPNLGPVMRLQFGNDVKEWLKKAFKKTHHRNEQRKAHGLNGPTIERLVPFWEFIDIEWDQEEETFHFRAWYTQGETDDDGVDSNFGSDDSDAKLVIEYSIHSAWLVLQNPESIYADVEGLCYEYPRRIPNGTRIAVGDYLICSLASKKSKDGKRLIGIGRISQIDEYTKNGKKMKKAFYDWYRDFEEPKTFEYIGGDPRVNLQHSMNPIPKNRVDEVVNLLVGEFTDDDMVMEKEAEYLNNLTSDIPETNQLPDWLSRALGNQNE